MRRDALFCDGTSSYVMPAEPKAGETVTLRFRTAENDVADVILLVGEEKARYTMQKADSIENFDFWKYSGRWIKLHWFTVLKSSVAEKYVIIIAAGYQIVL